MALFTIETLTIIAVIVIGAILAIYVTILKRNGWLDRNMKFYRCPNQGCRKVFDKPAEVKDLSEHPARVYRACPECGADVGTYLSSGISRKTMTEVNFPLARSNQKTATMKKREENKPVPETPRAQSVPTSIQIGPLVKAETRAGSPSNPNANTRGCKHYFGYLANREKQDTIPDECLECPKSLDCMLVDIKPKASVQEMKKWYQFKA